MIRFNTGWRTRYGEIISVLIKYGFGDILARLPLKFHLFPRPSSRPWRHVSRYERLRLACEELGPTFIKLGQILSTRPDLIPPEMAKELAKLQDTAPPFPFPAARQMIEEDLGPLDSIFSSIEENPVAAASIAQVHRAILTTGEKVAVKIQRPGIRKVVEEDISILRHLARLMERYVEEAAFYRPTQIVEEFARTIREELTFTVEAAYAERFRWTFRDWKEVYVPSVFRQATSDRILTMEYVEGIKVSELEVLDRSGYDRKLIARRGCEIILEQIFTHGFFHADPHPGNILILPDHVICFLDFGMMGYLDENAKDTLTDALIAYIERDAKAMAQAILKMTQYEEEPIYASLTRDVNTFMNLHLYKPIKQIRIMDIRHDLLELAYTHRLHLYPNYFFMLKALSQFESIGLSLDPDFDFPARIKPFVERLAEKRIWEKWSREILNTLDMLKSLPSDLHQTLRQINRGKLGLQIEQKGLEQTINELSRAANRLVMSLILSALILASSILTAMNQPILGIVGFSFAAIIGLGLLVSTFRSHSP